jgi:hypothetical protein
MTAEIRHDAGWSGPSRGMGFGRAGGRESLADRREAAQRRLSSTVRTAELVECALRAFDEALAEHAGVDGDGSLRSTVRSLLTLAYGTVDYDVMLLPPSGDVAVRVRHTPFGPEAEVVDLAPAPPETATLVATPPPPAAAAAAGVTPARSAGAPAVPAAPAAPGAPTTPPPAGAARPPERDADPDAVRDPTLPWWTPETMSR